MRTKLNIFALAVFVWSAGPVSAGENDVMLYKNPQCGCCEGHAEHLRDNGFEGQLGIEYSRDQVVHITEENAEEGN